MVLNVIRDLASKLIGINYPDWLYDIFEDLYKKTKIKRLLPVSSNKFESEFMDAFLDGYRKNTSTRPAEQVFNDIKSFSKIESELKTTKGNQRLLREKMSSHMRLFQELGSVLRTFHLESIQGLESKRSTFWKNLFKESGLDKIMQSHFSSLKNK